MYHRILVLLTITTAVLSLCEELCGQPPAPPAVTPADQAPAARRRIQRRSPLLSSRSRRSRRALANIPEVYGDALLAPVVAVGTGTNFVTASLPTAGGAGRLKVAEQNRAIPTDRIFFHYQHFEAGADVRRAPGVGLPVAIVDSGDFDRFTIGFEKTFERGRSSIEFRLPFSASIVPALASEDYTSSDLNIDNADLGNLSVLLKRMWLESRTHGTAYGIGIVAPTGGDVYGELPGIATSFEIENQAVYLVPFIGITGAPTDDFFYHAFIQYDIALSGNKITVFNGTTGSNDMTEQNVFSLELSGGCWLYRSGRRNFFQNLAGMAELHVNASTNDAEFVSLDAPTFGMRATTLENANATFGLHAGLANDTALRFGWTIPLNNTDQRFFDNEVSVFLRRQY